MALVVSSTSKLYSGFSPTSIPNCALWLDAADTSTITLSGSNVTQWRDKSSNALVMSQAVASNQPVLGPLLNNLQTLQFATTQSFVSTSNLVTNPTQSWFIVFNAYSNTNNNRFWLNHSCNIAATGGEYFYGGNGTVWTNRKSGNLALERAIYDNIGLGSSPFNSGQWYITNLVDSNNTTNTSSFLFRINGTSRAISIYSTSSNILTGTATVPFYLNTSGNTATPPSANTYYSEIILFNEALSIAQVQQVEGYLATKWGLKANLPAIHPFKTIPPSLRPFQPIDISGCALWLDAADPSTMTLSGSNVTAWNDKSGNGRNTSGGTAPTYSGNGVVFTGTQFLPVTNASGLFVNTAFSFFIVETLGGSTANRFFIGDDVVNSGGSANSSFHIGYRNNSNVTFAFYYNDLEITGLSGTGAARIWSFNMPATANRNARLNGSLVGTLGNSQKLTAMTSLMIGRCFASSYYTGTISEIVAFTRDMTTSEIQQVEGYLSTKWGLKSTFPSTHPYKSLPVLLPPFTPVQLSGCQLWLDAADRSTFTLSGSNITSWNDKSGNGRNATQFNTGFATYDSNANRVAITPTGQLSAPIPAGTFSSGITMFVIYQKYGANTTYNTLVTRTAGNVPAPFDLYGDTAGTSRLIGNGSAFTGSPKVDTFPLNTSVTMYGVFIPANSTWNETLNGTVKTFSLSTTYGDTATAVYIGTRGDKITNANIYVHEVIMFSSSISTSDRQQVEGYLAAKWGLKSSLPSSHPYKTIMP